MTQKPLDCATILLADPHNRKIALAKKKDRLIAPCEPIASGDGVADIAHAHISRQRLGTDESRATAFQDAALRALYERFGQLIAHPVPVGTLLANDGEWGHIARHHLAPDRMALTYLGRCIDPIDVKKRRHRRVFAAPLSRVSNSIGQSSSAKPIIWVSPEEAAHKTEDPALEPFFALILSALGGRPHPLRVSFRAGQRIETRL